MRCVTLLLLSLSFSLFNLACSDPDKDFQQALQKNSSEAFRAFIYDYHNNHDALANAITNTDNSLALETFALGCSDVGIQRLAVLKIKDQCSLVNIILAKPDTALQTLAWRRLTDQNAIKFLAETATAANDRGKALELITDDSFLAKRCDEDPSTSIRNFAVVKISSPRILESVATTAYYLEIRNAAAQSRGSNNKIAMAFGKLFQEVQKLKYTTDNNYLAAVAISGSCDTLCKAAVLRLSNQLKLTDVICKSRDREVRKYAFTKLTDTTILQRVSNEAADVSLKLAAAIILHKTTVDAVFADAVKPGRTSKDLGDALAAVALLPADETSRSFVTDACITLINRGDESRIPDLVELLHTYGDVPLAEDYLNCGQPDLDQAGRIWGSNHGYDVGTGYGSHRANWGSGR